MLILSSSSPTTCLRRGASEECIFMLSRKVIEHASTDDMFVTPQRKGTADYIEGRYG